MAKVNSNSNTTRKLSQFLGCLNSVADFSQQRSTTSLCSRIFTAYPLFLYKLSRSGSNALIKLVWLLFGQRLEFNVKIIKLEDTFEYFLVLFFFYSCRHYGILPHLLTCIDCLFFFSFFLVGAKISSYQISAYTTAKCLLSGWVCCFSVPTVVTTDNLFCRLEKVLE